MATRKKAPKRAAKTQAVKKKPSKKATKKRGRAKPPREITVRLSEKNAGEVDDLVKRLKGTKHELTHEQVLTECMYRAWHTLMVLAAGDEVAPIGLDIKGIVAVPGKDANDAMKHVDAVVGRFNEAFPMNCSYITVNVPGKNSKRLKEWVKAFR